MNPVSNERFEQLWEVTYSADVASTPADAAPNRMRSAGKAFLWLSGVFAMLSGGAYAIDAYQDAQPTPQEQEMQELQADCEAFYATGGVTDSQIVDFRDNISQEYATEVIRHEAYLAETCPTLPS